MYDWKPTKDILFTNAASAAAATDVAAAAEIVVVGGGDDDDDGRPVPQSKLTVLQSYWFMDSCCLSHPAYAASLQLFQNTDVCHHPIIKGLQEATFCCHHSPDTVSWKLSPNAHFSTGVKLLLFFLPQ